MAPPVPDRAQIFLFCYTRTVEVVAWDNWSCPWHLRQSLICWGEKNVSHGSKLGIKQKSFGQSFDDYIKESAWQMYTPPALTVRAGVSQVSWAQCHFCYRAIRFFVESKWCVMLPLLTLTYVFDVAAVYSGTLRWVIISCPPHCCPFNLKGCSNVRKCWFLYNTHHCC